MRVVFHSIYSIFALWGDRTISEGIECDSTRNELMRKHLEEFLAKTSDMNSLVKYTWKAEQKADAYSTKYRLKKCVLDIYQSVELYKIG
ncbi:MAG: hypothetical protein ABI851_10290 [Saprospiraceae bacterium]